MFIPDINLSSQVLLSRPSGCFCCTLDIDDLFYCTVQYPYFLFPLTFMRDCQVEIIS